MVLWPSEELPWADRNRTLTKPYMLFLAVRGDCQWKEKWKCFCSCGACIVASLQMDEQIPL